ncbi:peptidoglycan-binding domain-containing protein [Actinomyces culturomici]|uniref:peptidoglycan-binding domain-containing protein n=1 Tax=Actinomyces culturomici TaxID=1926276 RepID=UPI000E203B0C|nr:peptidoglycan-binding domain-containing protein [Actinomyces culturomici]
MRIPLRPLAIGAFACALVGCGGAALGALVLPPPVPASLDAAPALDSAPVETRVIDDARTIPLAFVRGDTTSIPAPLSGKMTALPISVGDTLESGEEIARIDGTSLIALATTTPLYRPIVNALEGDDVRALQTELARLGYAVDATGIADWNTRRAAADLLGIDDGAGGVPAEVPTTGFAWIPAASVTVSGIEVGLGATVDPTAALLDVTDSVERGVLTLPKEAMPGDRVITLSTGALPVPADGVITDPDTIRAIKESDQYAAFTTALGDGEGVFSVPWSLATPVSALVVPPSSLFGIIGADACVAHDGSVHKVRIVGSQLGQSYITSDDPLTDVDLDTEGLECR